MTSEEVLNDIVELYFEGGDLEEILNNVERVYNGKYIDNMLKTMFRNWEDKNGKQ